MAPHTSDSPRTAQYPR